MTRAAINLFKSEIANSPATPEPAINRENGVTTMEMVTETISNPNRPEISVDLFLPQAPSNGAAVILLHGGAWMFGDRNDMHSYAKLFAAKGFVAVAAQYRLLPNVRWPGQLEDVRDVIRWIKADAGRLNIDSTKVALVGFSAGAHLALLAAGTADGSGYERVFGDGKGSSVAAVISCFAPAILTADFTPRRPPQLDMLLEGGDDGRARALSPITYFNRAFPPTLFAHGDEDVAIPLAVTLRAYQALSETGAKPELHVFRAQNHEFTALPSVIGAVVDEFTFFLKRAVLEPENFIDEDRRLNVFARPETMAALMGHPKNS